MLSLYSVEGYFDWGPCPNPTLQPNFNISNYLGLWYDVVHCTDFYWELGGDCDTAQYTLGSDPNTLIVNNSAYVSGKWESYMGDGKCDPTNPPQCGVKFFVLSPYGDYRVVSTDYVNYSLVLSCENIGVAHDMWFWLLARSPKFNYTSFIPTIKSFGFPDSEIEYTDQVDCPAH